jgi:hypothetical protein
MPAEIDHESGDICVLRVSGVWKRSDFAAAQKEIAARIDAGATPRVLAILENFEGWERGTDWDDLDFIVSHSDKISKIAVVADPKWEIQALAFAGAGVRKAPVQFFSPDQLAEARNWIASK